MLARAMIIQIFVQPSGHGMCDGMIYAVSCKTRTEPFAEIPAAAKCFEARSSTDACQRLPTECRVLPVLHIRMSLPYGTRGASKH